MKLYEFQVKQCVLYYTKKSFMKISLFIELQLQEFFKMQKNIFKKLY